MRLVEGPGAPCAVGVEDLERLYDHPPGLLRAIFAVSLDGGVEVDGRSGRLGGPDDAEVLAAARSAADAVLVGAGTLRKERYGPAWLRAERRHRRLARGQAALPRIAVVSGSADLDPRSAVFCERRADQPEPPPPLVVVGADADRARRDALAEVAELVEVPAAGAGSGVDPVEVVGLLRRRGLGRILCEGGPSLFAGLLAAGLVDELCLTHSPLLVGSGRRTLGEGGPPLGPPVAWRRTHLIELDGPLAARYERGPLASPGR